MTKHGKVIRYVSQLPIGTKISVRTIANLLDISEGTAYKGIKECSKMGIVTTIPRIGTIRIRKPDYNGEEKYNLWRNCKYSRWKYSSRRKKAYIKL